MADNELFEIIVGTYEEYLLGYKFIKNDREYKLKHTVANHSHKGSLRSVAWHNKFLASAGTDECIHLYDLHLRKECGLLMHHSGTVTSLSFTPDGHYLISGSEDGSIAMFAVGSWVLDKVWSKAHKGKAVNSISVHPSGKMALSIGNDYTLRTWNLVKGRCAYIVNIASKYKRPEIIEWSLCGNYFGLLDESKVDVYSVADGNVIRTLQLKSKISSIQFLQEEKICLGDSIGNITCINFLTGDELWIINSKEENRIKCLKLFDDWLISGNSKGTISVHNISGNKKPILTTSLETSCRITCMTISQIPGDDKSQVITKRKKRKSVFETKSVNEEEYKNLKKHLSSKKFNVHCYPPDQKWHIELL
ncbi:hypothetical protein O3M35_011409 [Rhynocoris fuscipes]|uniref:P21-activated protein kinase-interacting protein 1-like n=1 Tax=Rhynocoris fuscipes TaxID=488301 RepID=A0AAW1D1D5_9HEMI